MSYSLVPPKMHDPEVGLEARLLGMWNEDVKSSGPPCCSHLRMCRFLILYCNLSSRIGMERESALWSQSGMHRSSAKISPQVGEEQAGRSVSKPSEQ